MINPTESGQFSFTIFTWQLTGLLKTNKKAIKIKETRESKNISQKAIARKLSMSISAYSRLENGEVQITLNTIEKISQELDICITEMISLTAFKNNNFNNNQLDQKVPVNLHLDPETLEKFITIINNRDMRA